VDQVLNRAINHYNGALSTTYNRIANLEAEVTRFQEELTRLPRGNVVSKTKVPEPPTFAGSENKMHLHDWLSQIALYCLASGITADDQKIICALTCLRAPAVRATGVEGSRRFLRELDEAPGGNNLHYILQCLRVPALVTRV